MGVFGPTPHTGSRHLCTLPFSLFPSSPVLHNNHLDHKVVFSPILTFAHLRLGGDYPFFHCIAAPTSHTPALLLSTIMDPDEQRKRLAAASEYEEYRSDSKNHVRSAIAGHLEYPGSESSRVASQLRVLPAPADPFHALFENTSRTGRPSRRNRRNARNARHFKHHSTSLVPIATGSAFSSPPSSPNSTGSVFRFESVRHGEFDSLTSFSQRGSRSRVLHLCWRPWT